MTDHTTHDLAIARAERDAWQSTCEELHRTIAGRDVEIEAHLGRCEAADQRARGLVAQAEALRADSRHHAAIAAQNATLASERDAAIARAEAAEADLRSMSRARDNATKAVQESDAAWVKMKDEHDRLRAELAAIRDAAEQARDIHEREILWARDGRRLTIRAAMIRALDLSGCDATRAADCADQALREFVSRKQL